MSDWNGTCRSNYFAVKDSDAFKEYISRFDAQIIESNGLYGFYSESSNGGMPEIWEDEKDIPVSILSEIHEHLQENHICVILEVGAEKARYLSGNAVAISHTGEKVTLDLDEIYSLAQEEFGLDAKITQANY